MAGHDAVDALIAFAIRDGLGEPVAWAEAEALILRLRDDPLAPRRLRRRLASIEDPEAAGTLREWFLRLGREKEADARASARLGEKLAAPFQTVGLGAFATAGIAFAAGTLAGAIALPVVVAAGVTAGVATFARWVFSVREDRTRLSAEALRHLAEVAAEGRE